MCGHVILGVALDERLFDEITDFNAEFTLRRGEKSEGDLHIDVLVKVPTYMAPRVLNKIVFLPPLVVINVTLLFAFVEHNLKTGPLAGRQLQTGADINPTRG